MNQPKENVEPVHNLDGMPPSDFSDISDIHIRTSNRGAVMANIFEQFVDRATRRILAKDFAMCTRYLERYLSRLPRNEVKGAKESMYSQLKQRGYVPHATTS